MEMSNDWITSITLKPIEYGMDTGALSFHITFSGITPTDGNVAMADALYRITHSGYKVKSVSLLGSFPNDALMLTFVMALKEAGFYIHAVIDGSVYYGWLGTAPKGQGRLADWITLDLHTIVWGGFGVDEVIYHITNVSDPDPILPEKCKVLYLLPPDELPPKDIITWMKRSKVLWHLNVSNPKWAKYQVQL